MHYLPHIFRIDHAIFYTVIHLELYNRKFNWGPQNKMKMTRKKFWPRRDLNTQPSDLESDALPLRHEVTTDEPSVYDIICAD